jgi:hypothetical protein
MRNENLQKMEILLKAQERLAMLESRPKNEIDWHQVNVCLQLITKLKKEIETELFFAPKSSEDL